MKNLKEIIIGIFAVIGVLALVTGFTNNTENVVQTTTPESHVWKAIQVSPSTDGIGRMFAINAITGEVRKYARGWPNSNRDRRKGVGKSFITYETYGSLDLD